MRKPSLIFYGPMALLLTALFLTLWGLEIFAGKGPWLSWNRRFEFLDIYTDLYAMALINAALIPTMIVTVWHTLVLLGRATPRPSIHHTSKFMAAITLGILAIVAVRFEVWNTLLGVEDAHSLPAPPSDADLKYPELPLKPAEDTVWEIQDLNGKTLTLADLKGKAVFLNFWATWCGFCKAEFPNIQKLHDALKDNPNIALILVTKEEPDTVKKWLQSDEGKPYTLPFYLTKDIPDAYAPSGWPTTYILAPDGRIAFRHSGFAAWDGEKTKDFLTRLAEK